MLQVIGRKTVYVVDFDTMPEMPITGLIFGEHIYKKCTEGATLLRHHISYAQALTHAFEEGIITEPGKYGIYLVPGTDNYEIYTIVE